MRKWREDRGVTIGVGIKFKYYSDINSQLHNLSACVRVQHIDCIKTYTYACVRAMQLLLNYDHKRIQTCTGGKSDVASGFHDVV